MSSLYLFFPRAKIQRMKTVKEYVAKRKAELATEISLLPKPPRFAILQVNDDPASNAYVNGKLRDSKELGIDALPLSYPLTISQDELLEEIKQLNNDPSIGGMIVQLPLPKHISEEAVKLAIDPKKDVDGFHPCSTFVPCTPKGIVEYLESIGFSFAGKNALIFGRSNIVGKPMAKLLLSKSCNVTVVHSKTSLEDQRFYASHADLIVLAIGKMHYLDDRFDLKPDAVLVDVGINRGEDGKLHGDIVPDRKVAVQTPVPGGVGLLTRLALMENVLEASKQ